MTKFHELNRQFRNLTDEEQREPHRLSALFGGAEPGNGFGWAEILSAERVVVLAEAGSGKTREMQAQAERLTSEGRTAFFMPIEALEKIAVRDYLVGEESKWDDWLNDGSKEAWIFLDAVDELKLTNGKLDLALRRVAAAVGQAKERAHIIVSCRPSDWRPSQDFETFKRLLPPSAPASTVEASGPDALLAAISRGSKSEHLEEATDETTKMRTVVLLPLGRDQIQRFAEAEGIKDAKAFVSEINRTEAWPFARRPLDLRGLIQVWKDSGTLGTLLKQHESDVDASLRDDPERADAGLLSLEDARAGAERLALAMMLTKTRTIHAPGQPEAGTEGSSLDPFEVLSDWDGARVRALLRRSLFDPATYGRIRFHHRSVQEFLAAQALLGLQGRGLPKRAVKRLLFADTYGERVVIPSMRPVAAWMSLTDHAVSKEVLDREPEVLLLHGDPQSLPLEARSALINAYVDRYGAGSWRGLDVWVSNVRRLAQPDLAPTVQAAWEKPRTNQEIADFLLQVIWLGKIQACADIALQALMDESLNSHARVVAGRALSACERTDLLRIAADDMLTNHAKYPDRVAHGIIDELFPNVITGAELEQLIRRNKEPKRTVGGFNWQLYNLADEIEPGSETSVSLRTLLANLVWAGRTPSDWHRPRSDFYYLTAALAKSTLRDLQRSGKADADLIKAAAIANRFHGNQTVGREEMAELSELIKGDVTIREAVFWTEYDIGQGIDSKSAADERGFQILHQSLLGRLQNDDWEWLLANAAKPALPSARAVILSFAIDVWYGRGQQADELEQLRGAIADSLDLIARLTHQTTPRPPNLEHAKMEREWAQREKTAATKEEKRKEGWLVWREKVVSDPAAAFTEKEGPNTFWNCLKVLQQARDHSSRLGYAHWRDLRRIFNDAIADGFATEAKRYWRATKAPIWSQRKPDERNSIWNSQSAALTALLVESASPGWAQALTTTDATKAAQWATCELNGVPEWFDDLAAAYPKEVAAVLAKELKAELKSPIAEHPHTLSAVRYGPESLKKLASPVLNGMLAAWPRPEGEDEARRAASALATALSIIIESGSQAATFAQTCREQFLDDPSAPPATAWLQALCATDLRMGLEAFRKALSKLSPDLRRSRPMQWFASVFGERFQGGPVVKLNVEAAVLMEFTKLAYEHVRRSEDVEHEGVYTPGARDEAESARNRLIGALMGLPGKAAYEALLSLAEEPLFDHMPDRLRMIARDRAAEDSEGQALSSREVSQWVRQFGHPPRNRDELFQVMCDRLEDIQEDLLHHDFNERAVLAPVESETVLQPSLAKKIEDAARGQYQVTREDEVADKKETDIRLLSRGSVDRAVIEIKVGDSWTVQQLEDTITKQLLALYMRHETCRAGCLLVTYAGRKKFKRPGTNEWMTFEQVIDHLKAVAKRVEAENEGRYLIAVVGLDFRSPLSAAQLPAAKSKTPPTTRKRKAGAIAVERKPRAKKKSPSTS